MRTSDSAQYRHLLPPSQPSGRKQSTGDEPNPDRLGDLADVLGRGAAPFFLGRLSQTARPRFVHCANVNLKTRNI
jgi:hypothetical protein